MRDPVCGMTVGASAPTAEGYPGHGFCSNHCLEAFAADPGRYVDQEAEAGAEEGDDPAATPA